MTRSLQVYLASFLILLCSEVFAFSFDEYLKQLAKYEQEIPNITAREDESGLRQKILSIRSKVKANQRELESEILTNINLLNALTDESSDTAADDETYEDAGSESSGLDDQLLTSNKEALQTKVDRLQIDLKKSRFVDVYANELLAKISEHRSQMFEEMLFTTTPILISSKGWPLRWAEVTKSIRMLSENIPIRPIILVIVGAIIIFGFGQRAYNAYFLEYNNTAPVKTIPKWTLFAILVVLILSNGVYYNTAHFTDFREGTLFLLSLVCLLLALLLYRAVSQIDILPREHIVDEDKVIDQRTPAKFLLLLIKLLIILAGILALAGYPVLSTYILYNTSITIAAIISFLFSRYAGEKLLRIMQRNDEAMVSPIGLIVFEFALGVVIFLIAARLWGFSIHNFKGQLDFFSSDYRIGNIHLDLQHLAAAVVTYVVILYIAKAIRWFLRERVFPVTNSGVGISEAAQAIVIYIGIILAIVMAFGALGVKWENLALIAGALSVGIGFGLQNIIGNFFSGLILLFERPVRVGDWVILGNGLEGHIKKINIRSTEIQTFEKSSVLIPNSNLLSDTITNWTLNDPVGRIDITVGVAYGSDTQRVKELLLEVANTDSGIRSYPKPQVLFIDFGESSLDFVLRIYLRNINNRFSISSNLRFAIDQVFRENNITIPFPQRDLHIQDAIASDDELNKISASNAK